MLQLEQLRLRNYALFQDQDFDFRSGLTVIGGANRVGKTLLLSPLRPLFFGVPNGEHLPKGSTVELDLKKTTVDGKTAHMMIGADSPKARPDWRLFVNKQDMAMHRKRDVRTMISNRISISEDLFDTTCHISASGRNLPLYAGSPASKMDWLTSVFNLAATYNDMQDKVAQQLAELAKDEVRLQTLRDSLAEVPERPDLERLAKRQKAHLKLKAQIADWSTTHARQEELRHLRTLRKALAKRKTKYTKKAQVEQRIEDIEDKLLRLRAMAEATSDYAVEVEMYKRATAKRAKLFKQLPEEFRPRTPEHINKLQVRLNSIVVKMHRVLKDAEASNEDYTVKQDALRMLETMKEPELSARQAAEALAKAKDDVSFATRTLNNVRHAGKNHKLCPECGTEMTKKHVHSVAGNYEARLETAKTAIYKAEKAISYWDLIDLTKTNAKYVDIDKFEKRIRRHEQAIEVLEQMAETLEVEKPRKPKGQIDGDPVRLQTTLDALRGDLALFVAHGRNEFPTKAELQDGIDQLEGELEGIPDVDIAELSDKASVLSEHIRDAEMQLRRYKDATKHNSHLEEEIATLSKRLKVLRPLKVLKEAFGRSGVLLNAMNDVIQHLLQELNTLVPLLLNEKFRVDIVTGPRKLNVLVERNGSLESIRTISSSEQRCWSLLFATAMLRILPNNMLTDTIILDELEANMDANSRRRYVTEFLPYLQTIVDKVIVVTPLVSGELILQPDHAYRVEKKNNVSTLRAL